MNLNTALSDPAKTDLSGTDDSILQTSSDRPDIFGTFFIGKNEFAFCVEAIQEVVNEPETFTQVPLSPDYLMGLFNLRGVVIPVIDLRAIFGLEPAPSDAGKGKVAIIEHGAHCFGLLVDQTGGVFNARDAKKTLFSRTGGELRETVVNGVFKLDNGTRLVQILDPYELLHLERVPRVAGNLRSSLNRRARGKRHQCISFDVGNSICAFDMGSIKEIVEFTGLDNTSLAHTWTLGAVDLRGNTVPVIDFRVFLGKSDADTCEDLVAQGCKLIVMKIGDNLISLLVDAIDNIMSFYDDDLLPFPAVGLHRGDMYKGCLSSETENMVLLLDHERLLSDNQLKEVTRGHSALFHENNEAKSAKKRTDKTGKRTLITFQVEHNFALDIEKVSEVMGFPDTLIEPPGVPECIEGMINLRGELIPIINLRVLYRLPLLDRTDTKLLVFNEGDKKYAIMVDAVRAITSITNKNTGVLPSLNDSTGAQGMSADIKEAILVKGEDVEEHAFMILELKALINRLEAAFQETESMKSDDR